MRIENARLFGVGVFKVEFKIGLAHGDVLLVEDPVQTVVSKGYSRHATRKMKVLIDVMGIKSRVEGTIKRRSPQDLLGPSHKRLEEASVAFVEGGGSFG